MLHPRTAGFVAAWEALQDAAKEAHFLNWTRAAVTSQSCSVQELQSKPPVLVDVTMALASVHMVIIEQPAARTLTALVTSLNNPCRTGLPSPEELKLPKVPGRAVRVSSS